MRTYFPMSAGACEYDSHKLSRPAFYLSDAFPKNSGIVALPCACIPSLRNTTAHVADSIFRSFRNVIFSTYRRSSSNFSSQERLLRPDTWASPVIPGRTSWRRFCRSLYLGRYSASRGLGPVMAMSPRTTFNNSGSSSRLVLVSILAKAVSRCSSASRFP